MENFYNHKLNINKEQNQLRLDQALAKLSNFTRSQIKILILNGNVKKNDKIIKETSYRVKNWRGILFKNIKTQRRKI